MASHVGAATSAPAFCVVHDADESSCLVCWAPVAGAKTYELQMRRVDGAYSPDKETAGADGFWMTLHTCEWTTLAGSLTSTRARKKGLDEDAAYEFRASVSRRQSYAWSPVATLAPRAGMSRLAAPVVVGAGTETSRRLRERGVAPRGLSASRPRPRGLSTSQPRRRRDASPRSAFLNISATFEVILTQSLHRSSRPSTATPRRSRGPAARRPTRSRSPTRPTSRPAGSSPATPRGRSRSRVAAAASPRRGSARSRRRPRRRRPRRIGPRAGLAATRRQTI